MSAECGHDDATGTHNPDYEPGFELERWKTTEKNRNVCSRAVFAGWNGTAVLLLLFFLCNGKTGQSIPSHPLASSLPDHPRIITIRYFPVARPRSFSYTCSDNPLPCFRQSPLHPPESSPGSLRPFFCPKRIFFHPRLHPAYTPQRAALRRLFCVFRKIPSLSRVFFLPSKRSLLPRWDVLSQFPSRLLILVLDGWAEMRLRMEGRKRGEIQGGGLCQNVTFWE